MTNRSKGASKSTARTMTTPTKVVRPAAKTAAAKTAAKPRAKGASKAPSVARQGITQAARTITTSVPYLSTIVGGAQALRPQKAYTGRRRRAAVPKTVKKWLKKTDTRMKAIEKAAKSFRKIINRYAPKSKHTERSEGTITRREAESALRR